MGMEEVPVELYREFMSDISDEIDRESQIIEDLLTLVRMDKSAESQMKISQVHINHETGNDLCKETAAYCQAQQCGTDLREHQGSYSRCRQGEAEPGSDQSGGKCN